MNKKTKAEIEIEAMIESEEMRYIMRFISKREMTKNIKKLKKQLDMLR